jgi:metal-sulfur cluster biosynthetic enzyme
MSAAIKHIDALRSVYDPELPVNIYDLGLIHGLTVDEQTGRVQIMMTLTAPAYEDIVTYPVRIQAGVVQVRDNCEDEPAGQS